MNRNAAWPLGVAHDGKLVPMLIATARSSKWAWVMLAASLYPSWYAAATDSMKIVATKTLSDTMDKTPLTAYSTYCMTVHSVSSCRCGRLEQFTAKQRPKEFRGTYSWLLRRRQAEHDVDDRSEDVLLFDDSHNAKEHYKERHERHSFQKCVSNLRSWGDIPLESIGRLARARHTESSISSVK